MCEGVGGVNTLQQIYKEFHTESIKLMTYKFSFKVYHLQQECQHNPTLYIHTPIYILAI